MATSSTRKNIQLVGTFVFGLYFLFVAVSHYQAAEARYSSSQPFENGLMAQAKIIHVPERSRDGTLFRFKDNLGQTHESRSLVYYPEYLRVGQTYEISYEPENTAWVRAPSLGWTESEYAGWRLMSIVWMVGAICVFPLGLWRRFRTPPIEPEFQISEYATEYRVKQHYLRLVILWATYAFALFCVYAIITLSITHFLPLPPLLKKLALLGWHALLIFALVPPALRIIFNDPLKITSSGVSIYGRRTIPWKAMSQIMFVVGGGRHQDMSWRLIIQLKKSSGLKGFSASGPALRKLSPLVYLDLYVTQWDNLDIIKAMNHFGLAEHDPIAAESLLWSASESGPIENRNGDGNEPVASEGSEATTLKDNQDLLDQKKESTNNGDVAAPKTDYYMSGGFHVDNR